MGKERPWDTFGFEYVFCEEWLFNNYKLFCRQKYGSFYIQSQKATGALLGLPLVCLHQKCMLHLQNLLRQQLSLKSAYSL